MDAPSALALTIAALAAAIDIRSRRIPNLLTFGGAAAALAYFALVEGTSGLAHGAAGWTAGVVLFLPIFLLGGMGAGDVKLLAAIGAWLGPEQTLYCALYSVLAGGLLGVAVAARQRYLGGALRNLWHLIAYWRGAGVRPMPGLTLDEAPGPRLAYGAAVLTGTVAVLFIR
jgi:prepilin peptidase CpaA